LAAATAADLDALRACGPNRALFTAAATGP